MQNWEGFGLEELPFIPENNDQGEDAGDPTAYANQESIESITRFIALFVLKTKEENQLSQQVLNSILDNMGSLVEQSLDALKSDVKLCLTNSGIDIADIDGLSEVLEQPSLFARAKSPLATEYLQVKYFVDNFDFIVSFDF
jgi:hypothetical protein